MSATAENLQVLHQLHQRARALRDRLASGPKTVDVRKVALANRLAQLERTRKELQDIKVQLKKNEHSLQGVDTKIDDLRTKLNLVKKNEEYKALQNQIAHENFSKAKVEEEVLVSLEAIEAKSAELAQLEAEWKRSSAELAALEQQIDAQAVGHQAQLEELDRAIALAEDTIPEEYRDRYRRIVARYGADALAECEDDSCRGCFTSVTAQMINDLINGTGLSFCLSCGRLLYRTEPEIANTRRNASK